MDEDMWLHPATRNNVKTVRAYGNQLLAVGHGELASGLIGEGRMAEPEEIMKYLASYFSDNNKPLKGLNALVTAGPTYERLDPVRFIGNFSTGKMGIHIAEALADKGAKVCLVLGPSHLQTFHPNVKTIRVESADEMYDASTKAFGHTDIAVLSAAVADYMPGEIANEKIKKQGQTLDIKLTKTPDILASLGKVKRENQLLVGFALETTNELENAIEKMNSKNADMIVLNSLRDEGAGFGHDTNKITLLARNGYQESFPLLSKQESANVIVNHILELRHAEKTV